MSLSIPLALREPCEKLMMEVQKLNQSPENFRNSETALLCLVQLQTLFTHEPQDSQLLLRWVEFITIPLFLLLPSEAEKAPQVPERIREEVLGCFHLLISRLPTVFTIRTIDLTFPLLLRVLATLTDVSKQNQLLVALKEETKMQCLHVLHSLFSLPIVVNHSSGESPFTMHTSLLLLDLSSKQHEKSRPIRVLALETLTCLWMNPSFTSQNQAEMMFPGACSLLCESAHLDPRSGERVSECAMLALQALIQVAKPNQDQFDPLFARFIRIFPIGTHNEQEITTELKLVRTELLCQILIWFTQGQSSQRLILFSKIALACFGELENPRFEQCLARVEPLFSLQIPMLVCDSFIELGNVDVNRNDVMKVIATLLTRKFPFQTKLALHQRAIIDALLLVFELTDENGKLELLWLDSKPCHDMVQTLIMSCPSFSKQLFDALLDTVRVSCEDGIDEAEEDSVLQLPVKELAPVVYLLSELGCHRVEVLLAALLDMDSLWYTNESSLVSLSLLACLSTCARGMTSATFSRFLVDCLYPILHCLGDPRLKVQQAAESCLLVVADVCNQDVNSLLLRNVDYIVDALVRRLPMLRPGDVRFARVIHVLVSRIPMWVNDNTVSSPWIPDLVQTVLEGLDEQTNSAKVVWSLLRIAQVVVRQADQVNSAKKESVPSLPPLPSPPSLLDAALAELSHWTMPPENGQQVHDSDQDEKEEEEESNALVTVVESTLDPLECIERILDKCSLFFSDADVLVRHQAIQVASQCVVALGMHPTRIEKTRQAVHRMWPSVLAQLKEEGNPEGMSLLIESLTVASACASEEKFFARKLSEDAWPVLERVLLQRECLVKRRREQEVAKRILLALPKLGKELIILQADRIALATSPFLFETSPLRREAMMVWFALAEWAGDSIWLAVALASGKVEYTMPVKVVLRDRAVALKLWDVLDSQG